MANKSVSFDFAVITKIIVGVLLICLGITGFISYKHPGEFTNNLYNQLLGSNEALIYIISTVVLLAGAGIIVAHFVSGMPPVIGKVCGIVAVVFWVLVIIYNDFYQLKIDKLEEIIDFLQSFAVDVTILIAVLQSTVLSKKE